ncbi:CidA/LrgA family protein [Sansalvadorimonas sp. 2012CJ34-2]|uniref:CidA/LrgA family protein n=1 Tax=Parendozoicomonas callyspongiae TaxID=2942213 RepID=A0ABT0PIF3_9GAMM|nr:CidA/LrgA family protein [Sansalvadorimonas sp. 2012CJ34-2]MCL6271174.1 CidA/LrgA family protein [Sansalvadorimonas sp. 2012CJ34-2]
MNAMRGLFILFLFQTLGEFGNRLLGLPLPGPVLGMLLLFLALCLIKSVPDDLDKSSQVIVGNMAMLLVPVATGFAYYLVKIQQQILPIALAATLGTVIAIVFTSLLMNSLIKKESEDE